MIISLMVMDPLAAKVGRKTRRRKKTPMRSTMEETMEIMQIDYLNEVYHGGRTHNT
jgi:hypothetical protein